MKFVKKYSEYDDGEIGFNSFSQLKTKYVYCKIISWTYLLTSQILQGSIIEEVYQYGDINTYRSFIIPCFVNIRKPYKEGFSVVPRTFKITMEKYMQFLKYEIRQHKLNQLGISA